MKYFGFCLALVMSSFVLCAVPFFAADAQGDLDNEFVDRDGTLRLHYPSDWTADQRDDGPVILGSAHSNEYVLILLTSGAFDQAGIATEAGDVPADVVEAYIDANQGILNFDQSTKVNLGAGRQAAGIPFTSDDPDYEWLTNGYVLIFTLGDSFGMIVGYGSDGVEAADLKAVTDSIARTIELGEFTPPGAVTSSLPTITDLGGGTESSDGATIIAQLEDFDLIPPGSESVYGEDMLIHALTPGLNIDEGSESEYIDYAMGALISLRVEEDETAICGLLTRVTEARNGDLDTFLVVGATETNTIVVIERYDQDNAPFIYQSDAVDVDFHDPQHLMYYVRDNLLTAFVNGEAVIEALPVPPMPEAPVRAGVNLDSDCVMTAIWAYGLPSEA